MVGVPAVVGVGLVYEAAGAVRSVMRLWRYRERSVGMIAVAVASVAVFAASLVVALLSVTVWR